MTATAVPLPYVYDDGGRSLSGFAGKTDAGDCVARAIAIAGRLPYRAVYDDLGARAAARGGRKSARDGVPVKVLRAWFADNGWAWQPRMRVGSTERTHLVAGELPAEGALVCRLSGHLVAVVDGVVHDNHDPRREGTRLVYGYWTAP